MQIWPLTLSPNSETNKMISKSKDEAEGGMIRALLGYQLLSISDEDLVVSIREDAFIYSIESLKSE